MKALSEYRALARENLKERWNDVALMTAVYICIAVVLMGSPYFFQSSPQVLSGSTSMLVAVLLLSPLQFAMMNALLLLMRGNEDTPLNNMFNLFTGDYSRYVAGVLLTMIIVVLVSIPTLGILGIVFGFAYQMVPYLMHDYPEMGVREAMRLSRQMMKGHKWQLFCLEMSFIGWALLTILTLGIGLIWLEPYIYTSIALFYEDIKKEQIVEVEDNQQ